MHQENIQTIQPFTIIDNRQNNIKNAAALKTLTTLSCILRYNFVLSSTPIYAISWRNLHAPHR
jgi:hypothetical protein